MLVQSSFKKHIYKFKNGDSKEICCKSDFDEIPDLFFIGSNIKSVDIPDTITTIGERAFESCKNLTDITIPDSVTSIGENAFSNCSGLTSITIPDSVTSIGENAFSECISLPAVDNIQYADTYAVAVVDNTQTSYVIKEGTKWIGTTIFYYCTSMTDITLPDSVKSIGECAFMYCNGLTSITIPSSVTSIKSAAFEYCKSLEEVTVLSVTPPALGSYVFDSNASGRKIYVPSASVNAYKSANGWKQYKNYIQAIP